MFNLSIGRTPPYLRLGVINNETISHCSYESHNICDTEIPLSCKYINEIENHGIILVINILCIKNIKFNCINNNILLA